MKITLQRDSQNTVSTQGHLVIDGQHAGYTLERPPSQYPADYHCIPAGTYPISIYDSPRFARPMPLLAVPGHSGIEIHWGNEPVNSHGCILVGKEQTLNTIWHTREKFDELFPAIQAACEAEGCEIEVIDPPGTQIPELSLQGDV